MQAFAFRIMTLLYFCKKKGVMQKELLDQLSENSTLNDVQDYIKKVINARGFGAQPIEQRLLLLMEEVGELAKAIRKEKTNMCIDKSKINNYESIESEIADVFIVLVSICNGLDINLFESLKEKEAININRKWEQ